MTNFQTKKNKTILLVGLGNPGNEYARARHNVGFMVIDELKNLEFGIWNLESGRKKFNAETYRNKGKRPKSPIQNSILILAKPQTYMNNSGEAVSALTRFYKIQPANLWVVYDDLYLPLGKLRVRESGGSGGHNGMQSIIDHMGTQKFPRFRIGIGPLPKNSDPAVFVLKPFLKTELVKMRSALQGAVEALRYALDCGVPKAMSKFNSL